MKNLLCLLLLFLASDGFAQKIFPYEKDIQDKSRYVVTDVDFYDSVARIRLQGTLIRPKMPHQHLVIIIPGSGKDTRHAHFVLAEHLLQHNIAVFRFDEAGVGLSDGHFDPSATGLETATNAAFQKLHNMPENQNVKMGLLGHSLGGFASMATYAANKQDVSFVIQMAAPVTNLPDNFIRRAARGDADFYFIPKRSPQQTSALLEKLYATVRENRGKSYADIRKKAIAAGTALDFRKNEFLKFLMGDQIAHILHEDMAPQYREIATPTLYLIGNQDTTIDPDFNIGLLNRFNNPHIRVSLQPGLNHWLTQHDAPAGTSLYQMDGLALETIGNFILGL